MGYEFEKVTGRILETKPVYKSVTIWAGAGTIAIGLLEALPELIEQVGPFLPPHILGIATATAGVVVILRRVYAKNPQIKGTVSDE